MSGSKEILLKHMRLNRYGMMLTIVLAMLIIISASTDTANAESEDFNINDYNNAPFITANELVMCGSLPSSGEWVNKYYRFTTSSEPNYKYEIHGSSNSATEKSVEDTIRSCEINVYDKDGRKLSYYDFHYDWVEPLFTGGDPFYLRANTTYYIKIAGRTNLQSGRLALKLEAKETYPVHKNVGRAIELHDKYSKSSVMGSIDNPDVYKFTTTKKGLYSMMVRCTYCSKPNAQIDFTVYDKDFYPVKRCYARWDSQSEGDGVIANNVILNMEDLDENSTYYILAEGTTPLTYELNFNGAVKKGNSQNNIVPQEPKADDAKPVVRIQRIAEKSIRIVGNLKKKTFYIKWGKTKNANDYCISYRKAGTKQWNQVWSKGKNSNTLKKVKVNSLYDFKITPYNINNGTSIKGHDSRVQYRLMQTVSKVKIKANGKKRITVKWSKKKAVTGYQVVYAFNKKMKSAKTKTIKGAKKITAKLSSLKKGKPCYVKVRPYKVKNGKNYLGVFSPTKKINIK